MKIKKQKWGNMSALNIAIVESACEIILEQLESPKRWTTNEERLRYLQIKKAFEAGKSPLLPIPLPPKPPQKGRKRKAK